MTNLFEFFEVLFWATTITEALFWGIAFWGLWHRRASGQIRPVAELAVSVIIAARNEAPQLHKNLAHWLQQEGITYELIVVDHASDDETPALLGAAVAAHPETLRVQRVAREHETLSGKKIPLQAGIAAARHPMLVFTDADCCPASKHWLACMAAPFAKPHIDFVLGISPYRPLTGFLGWIIGAETLHTALLYTSAAHVGAPFMGVGRNMAVRRRLFDRHGGYGPHQNLPSGDDDLLVNRLARARNTEVVTMPNSQTSSPPPSEWRRWWRQKVRHTSVATRYRPFSLALIGMLWLSGFGWWMGGLGSLLTQNRPWVALGFGLMVLAKGLLYVHVAKQWHYPGYGPAQFLALLLHPVFIQPLLGILSLTKPRFTWR